MMKEEGWSTVNETSRFSSTGESGSITHCQERGSGIMVRHIPTGYSSLLPSFSHTLSSLWISTHNVESLRQAIQNDEHIANASHSGYNKRHSEVSTSSAFRKLTYSNCLGMDNHLGSEDHDEETRWHGDTSMTGPPQPPRYPCKTSSPLDSLQIPSSWPGGKRPRSSEKAHPSSPPDPGTAIPRLKPIACQHHLCTQKNTLRHACWGAVLHAFPEIPQCSTTS